MSIYSILNYCSICFCGLVMTYPKSAMISAFKLLKAKKHKKKNYKNEPLIEKLDLSEEELILEKKFINSCEIVKSSYVFNTEQQLLFYGKNIFNFLAF